MYIGYIALKNSVSLSWKKVQRVGVGWVLSCKERATTSLEYKTACS